MRLTLLAFIIGITTAGCGLKGPLYLPSKTPETTAAPPAATPAPADESDQQDND